MIRWILLCSETLRQSCSATQETILQSSRPCHRNPRWTIGGTGNRPRGSCNSDMAPPMHKLPHGDVAVTVSLINPVNFGPSVLSRFMAPMVPGLETFESAPSLSFLLEHPSGRKLVWDLGIRKDFLNYAPSIAEYLPTTKYNIRVEKDVAEILQERGIDGADVEAIIWSHWHWDHIGNPDTFPKTTKLVVGRGFKQAMLPGAPANPQSPILQSDYDGRELVEINFQGPRTSTIGPFDAFDYFGDGSLYLLDSPGHAVGHMCALVRTTTATAANEDSTFVLLGGDVCHYAGIFRPSQYMPVPETVEFRPRDRHESLAICPGHAWEELQSSRNRQATDSLFDMTFGLDIPLACNTRDKLQELDCDDNIFVIIAHDASVRDGVDHFPQPLNQWKAKGWGQKMRWDFFRELEFYFRERDVA